MRVTLIVSLLMLCGGLGLALAAVAFLAPAIGLAAVPLALLAVLAHAHAYVSAGHAVPLA